MWWYMANDDFFQGVKKTQTQFNNSTFNWTKTIGHGWARCSKNTQNGFIERKWSYLATWENAAIFKLGDLKGFLHSVKTAKNIPIFLPSEQEIFDLLERWGKRAEMLIFFSQDFYGSMVLGGLILPLWLLHLHLSF